MMTPAPIVVAESQGQIGFLFSFLILVFAVALARGVAGAHTTAGAAAAAVFCGAFIVSVLVGWIVMIRRPARLEIAAHAIRFVATARHPPCRASREMSFASSGSTAGR